MAIGIQIESQTLVLTQPMLHGAWVPDIGNTHYLRSALTKISLGDIKARPNKEGPALWKEFWTRTVQVKMVRQWLGF